MGKKEGDGRKATSTQEKREATARTSKRSRPEKVAGRPFNEHEENGTIFSQLEWQLARVDCESASIKKRRKKTSRLHARKKGSQREKGAARKTKLLRSKRPRARGGESTLCPENKGRGLEGCRIPGTTEPSPVPVANYRRERGKPVVQRCNLVGSKGGGGGKSNRQKGGKIAKRDEGEKKKSRGYDHENLKRALCPEREFTGENSESPKSATTKTGAAIQRQKKDEGGVDGYTLTSTG